MLSEKSKSQPKMNRHFCNANTNCYKEQITPVVFLNWMFPEVHLVCRRLATDDYQILHPFKHSSVQPKRYVFATYTFEAQISYVQSVAMKLKKIELLNAITSQVHFTKLLEKRKKPYNFKHNLYSKLKIELYNVCQVYNILRKE